MKIYRCQQGFTIVELLLYLGLLTGFLLVLTDIFVSALDVEKESQANAAVSWDSQYILGRLIYDASLAQDILMPSSPGQTTNTLQLSVDGAIYTYAITGDTLSLTTDSSVTRLGSFATTISGFNVTKIGNPGGKPTAKVGFTVESNIVRPEGRQLQTFQTTVGVR